MKKIIAPLALLMVVISLSVGCKKIITNVFDGFDVDAPEIVVTIPFVPVPVGTPVPGSEIPLGTFKQPFNLDSAIKARTSGQFGAGDVNSVKIKKMVFTLSNADQANNLANFESARVQFSSNSNSTVVPIASFAFPDTYADTKTFEADANTPQLADYLKGSELNYYVYGKLRRYTTKSLRLAVVVTLTVR